jgi:erythromycin esterase-like protein
MADDPQSGAPRPKESIPMRRMKSSKPARLLASAIAGAVGFAAAPAVGAGSHPEPVTRWVQHRAAPLDTVDPSAPLDDMAPLRLSIGDAEIVGLGESVHGASEELTLKHRALRVLVEQMGFRSIAWEEDWAVGRDIDAYIRGGEGDLGALVSRMSPQWHSREVADVLRWLRDYNRGRSDQVGFVGVEYYLTGPTAYDTVEGHVAEAAPARLAELRSDLQTLRPTSPDIFAHIAWYQGLEHKEPYIEAAHRVLALVQGLPPAHDDASRELTVQQARQIVWFYEHFSLSAGDALVLRDARAAQNLQWWRAFSGDKIAYWAASPHTANAPELRIADPPAPDMRFPSAGSYLRARYGRQYRSIGFTFDEGTVRLGPDQTTVLSPPALQWFERPLGDVELDQFSLDLRRAGPAPVRRWLEGRVTTRGLPDGGPGAHMAGGSLAQWFDVIVHRQRVTPAAPL